MKVLLIVVILLVALRATADTLPQRPSFSLKPMDWSVIAEVDLPLPVVTKKDLLVYVDKSNSTWPIMGIRRRNANNGTYEHVADFTYGYEILGSTNGKWVSLFVEGAYLFNVDANNKVSEISYIYVNGGYLLSDDTFVGYEPQSRTNDGNYTISTYEFVAENNTWTSIPGTELTVTTEVNWRADYSTYRITDTHLVIADYSDSNNITIDVYERQVNRSWSLVESVPVNSTYGYGSVNFNGNDTLVYSSNNGNGIVFFYTKINGKWIEQIFTIDSVGYRPIGGIGYSVLFIDPHNVLVSAPFEGFNGAGEPTTAGKILMLSRHDNGMWQPVADIVGPGLWGFGLGMNDYDIITQSAALNGDVATFTYYTVPRCFVQPINVTCNDQQVNDCSQLDVSALYTINNPQCGAVTASFDSISLVDNHAFQASFSFTKSLSPGVYCNATVTCPAPPIVTQQLTPSKVTSSGALFQVSLCLVVSSLLSFI